MANAFASRQPLMSREDIGKFVGNVSWKAPTVGRHIYVERYLFEVAAR